MSEKNEGSRWQTKDFPGVNAQAFRIVNDWSKAMGDWEKRVRAMGAIMQVMLDVHEDQFARVLKTIENHKHSRRDIEEALWPEKFVAKKGAAKKTAAKKSSAEKNGNGRVSTATDVLGHPPDPILNDPVK